MPGHDPQAEDQPRRKTASRDLQGEYGYRRETGVCSRCEKGERLVIGRTK